MKIKRLFFVIAMLVFCLNMTAFAEDRRPLSEGEVRPRWIELDEDALPRKNEWHHRAYDGAWVYLDETGYTLQNTWAEINGKWYYFDEYCYMLHDTITPDGYTVGPDGAWIPAEAGSDVAGLYITK